MPSTLIKNGTVVTADRSFPADILIDGEKIRDIASSLPAEQASRVIDELRREGLQSVVLTGDHSRAAELLRTELHLDDVRATSRL